MTETLHAPLLPPNDANDPANPPRVGYWHLWTDEQGVSHHAWCMLEHFTLKGVGAAAPQWNDPQPRGQATTVFTIQPVGWVGEWHENPAPQWIVPLSGRWWVEAMDGTRVEMGPGELAFGEDQGCIADAAGRKGHRSGTIGGEPARLMTVQLHVAPVHRPGHLR
ncbi:cupin domain-containing protein [Robbsia sp. Bb-Pol-6]|uniref:Cupin domain-containing protein n=1 Tax=Robbsia betulipollinis TaxID=2981849 RepID=A0ABT3ZJT4_9BURK|nr:cupin domain-containing protein [Robbsia betulipollinis]MCY0386796.1 cupin domain-containing protein [Robbsia betulipollinis]